MRKKLLSALLCLSLCLSLLPAALAEDGETFYDYPYQTYDPDTMRYGLSRFVDGEEIILLPKEYDYISNFKDGTAIVQKNTDTYGSTYGLVDYNGSFILPAEYSTLSRGSYDEADNILRARKREENFYRYLRSDGTPLTDFTFTECEEFCRLGVGKREIGGKELYGAVNTQGETVIPFEYDYLSPPAPSYYDMEWISAEKDGCYGAFAPNGNLLRRCIYPSETAMTLSLSLPTQMSEEEEINALIAASQTWEPYLYDGDIGNGLWGYKATQYDTEYSPSGSVFWAEFASAEPFDETGHAQVTLSDGTVGAIDQSGRFTPAPLNDRFSDVLAGSWYDRGVSTCADKGIMVGTGEGRFSPAAELTDPECLTLALRLYDLRRDGDGTLEKAPTDAEGLPAPDKWYRDAVYTAYQWSLDGADGFNVLVDWCTSQPDPHPTSRSVFARALAVAAGELEKKYDVARIPDMERSEYNKGVYSLYEAGILNGTDSFGTFQADKELTRAECAVMVARVLDSAQRLTSPPATPNGYEQAVIDLRSKTGHHNEQRLETDECTIFIYDRGGFMNAPTGAMTVIYKPGSQLGDGYVLDLPHAWVKRGLAICYPADTMTLSEDGKTFTYTYYREEDLGEPVRKAGAVTYTVDLPTGEVTETWAPHSYATSLAHVTRKRGGNYYADLEVVETLEAPDCTVVLTRSQYGEYDDYALFLVYKPGSALGDGAIKRLILPSTVPAIDYSKYRPTDRAPDSLALSEDGAALTYSYSFTEVLEYYGEVLHEAGEYIYTADLTTGEVTARIDPASQRDIAYYNLLDSLKTEEGYKEKYSYHNYGTFQLPDGVETVLRCKPCPGDPDKQDYEFYLVRRDAQPQLLRLPLPSTEVLPDGSAPTTREPDSIRALSDPENNVTVAYSYRFTEQLWNGNAMLHDKGTYTYTVDVTTGKQSVVLEDSYWKALADAIQTGGTWRIDHQLETPLCTILVQHSEGGTDDRGNYLPSAHVTLIFKEGSPNGTGEVVDLPVLSGTLRYGSIPPHRVWLSEDKTVFTYVYQFDKNQYATFLSGQSYLNLKAGTYTYTVDLAAGTVEETIELKEE